jgi:hypothetical protein
MRETWWLGDLDSNQDWRSQSPRLPIDPKALFSQTKEKWVSEYQEPISTFPTQSPRLKCSNCGEELPPSRRLKAFCSYACRGQLEVLEATANHSGLVCSKNTKQNKALQSLKRQSVGAVTFAKINSTTIRVDCSRKKSAGCLMEVAWPGVSRQRWVARVGDRGSKPLPLDAAKQAAVAFFRERSSVRSRDWTAQLNQIAAEEVDHASLQQERRRWPIDLMNGRRRGFVEHRAAIIETELAVAYENVPSLLGDDFALVYCADGYPKLPECLRRTVAAVPLLETPARAA